MRTLIGFAVFVVGCKGGSSNDDSAATFGDDSAPPSNDTGSNADDSGTSPLTTAEHTAQYNGGSVGILGAGRSLAGIGDMNGDGFDDLLIGQAGSNDNSGAAALVLGSSSPGDVDLATQAITYSSSIASELVGTAVAPAGDYDGDGFADLLIGACHCYPEAGVGGAYVVLGSGAPMGLDLIDADARLTGEAIGDDAGDVVAGGGDFDGDGFDDVVVGANRTAYLILGGETVADRGLDGADARFEDGVPIEIAYAGDIDADGLDDLVFLDLGDVARLVLGSGGSSVVDLDDDADATYTLGDLSARAADGAGDVNGDGAADLALSGRVSDGAGAAIGDTWLFLGGEIGDREASDADATYVSEVGDDSAGFRIAGAGDVDGDELDDLLIGAPNYLDTYGASYIVLGSTEPASRSLDDADVRIVGADFEFVGLPLGDAGDFDGDGLADIVIGSELLFTSTYYLFTGADLAD